MSDIDELVAMLREAKSIIREVCIVYGCPEPSASIERISAAIAKHESTTNKETA